MVSRAATASRASCAAWKVACGKPPSASEICSGVMDLSSAVVFPASDSANREEHAIEVTQPRVRKRASAIRPASRRTESSKTSPHTGFSTVTVAVGASRVPGLRGFWKWSRTAALYTRRVSLPGTRSATRGLPRNISPRSAQRSQRKTGENTSCLLNGDQRSSHKAASGCAVIPFPFGFLSVYCVLCGECFREVVHQGGRGERGEELRRAALSRTLASQNPNRRGVHCNHSPEKHLLGPSIPGIIVSRFGRGCCCASDRHLRNSGPMCGGSFAGTSGVYLNRCG
jgi:hypothetical protein